MSLSRFGEDGLYFDVDPGYVYVTSGPIFENEFNVGIRGVEHFCEMSMRALAQSGELDDEELAKCEQAFRTRFSYVFDEGEDGE